MFLLPIDHLVMISVERYIAIKYSLRYSDIVTRKWLKTGVLLAWAFAVLVMTQETIIAVADTRNEFFSSYLRALNVVYLIIGIFYLAVVSYANVYMCLETKRHKKTHPKRASNLRRSKKSEKRSSLNHHRCNGCIRLHHLSVPNVSVESYFRQRYEAECKDNSVEMDYNTIAVQISP